MGFTAELIIILVMLVLNGFFAAYEMALASVSRAQLVFYVHQKKRGAKDALYMKDRMEGSLAIVQVGITLVGAIAAATGGAGAIESLAPHLRDSWHISLFAAKIISLIFIILPLSFFTIIFAELIPKTYALHNKEWVCLKLSTLMKSLAIIINPLVVVMESCVKFFINLFGKPSVASAGDEGKHSSLRELTAAVSMARASKLIGAQEEKIVLSAANLSVRQIREIMIPNEEICMIALNNTLTDALIKAHLDMHTRFPVCEKENDPQTIVGYLNFKDIMAALKLNPTDPMLKGIIRPIKKISEDMIIARALDQMIRERLHIALVCSKDGLVIGMITLEDIIEELVGDIEDEFDRLPSHVYPYGEDSWIMGGGVTLAEIEKKLDFKFEDGDLDRAMKLADWCDKRTVTDVKGGDTIQVDGIQVTVRKMKRKQMSEGIVRKV